MRTYGATDRCTRVPATCWHVCNTRRMSMGLRTPGIDSRATVMSNEKVSIRAASVDLVPYVHTPPPGLPAPGSCRCRACQAGAGSGSPMSPVATAGGASVGSSPVREVQSRFCRSSVLASSRSLRMTAVSATFGGLPRPTSSRYLRPRSGLCRIAATADRAPCPSAPERRHPPRLSSRCAPSTARSAAPGAVGLSAGCAARDHRQRHRPPRLLAFRHRHRNQHLCGPLGSHQPRPSAERHHAGADARWLPERPQRTAEGRDAGLRLFGAHGDGCAAQNRARHEGAQRYGARLG